MDTLQYQDIIFRAEVATLIPFEKKLKDLGAHLAGVDVQTDTYFKVEKGKLKWRQGNMENLIMHYERVSKGQDEATLVYRHDLDPEPADIADLRRDYDTLGEIHKTRQIYWLDSNKVYLDQHTSGECFVEIEVIDRGKKSTSNALTKQATQIRVALDIKEEQLVPPEYFSEFEE